MSASISSYQHVVSFRAERFNPVAIAENERVKVILACFEAGQFIPVHHPRVDLTLVVLEGNAVVVAGNQEVRVGPGAVIFVPSGEARGIRAETRFIALHTVTPPPTAADHTEVATNGQQGIWR